MVNSNGVYRDLLLRDRFEEREWHVNGDCYLKCNVGLTVKSKLFPSYCHDNLVLSFSFFNRVGHAFGYCFTLVLSVDLLC